MRSRFARPRPGLEALEGRLALSASAITPPAAAASAEVAPPVSAAPDASAPKHQARAHVHTHAVPTVPASSPGTGPNGEFTLADLRTFSVAYLSTKGSGFYNPSYDFNHNGFIGHGDAQYLVRHEQPLTADIPLRVKIALAPGQGVQHTGIHNSGGITRLDHITIEGQTTPGSIVFTDNGTGNYAFNGKALATDAQGRFSYNLTLTDFLTNTEYEIIDPFGHQLIAAFPILRVGPARK